MGNRTQPTDSVVDSVPQCHCLGVDNQAWHDELVELFASGPEFIDWGNRLMAAAHQAGPDRELTRVAGSHVWDVEERQAPVFELASALEDLVEALAESLERRVESARRPA